MQPSGLLFGVGIVSAEKIQDRILMINTVNLPKKEQAVDIEILVEPASPNHQLRPKTIAAPNKRQKGCISKSEISEQ